MYTSPSAALPSGAPSRLASLTATALVSWRESCANTSSSPFCSPTTVGRSSAPSAGSFASRRSRSTTAGHSPAPSTSSCATKNTSPLPFTPNPGFGHSNGEPTAGSTLCSGEPRNPSIAAVSSSSPRYSHTVPLALTARPSSNPSSSTPNRPNGVSPPAANRCTSGLRAPALASTNTVPEPPAELSTAINAGSLNCPFPVPGNPARHSVSHTSNCAFPSATPQPHARKKCPPASNSCTR